MADVREGKGGLASVTHYHDEQARTIEYETDGRMSLSEVVSLLGHLNNDYQRPWINSFYYSYGHDNRTRMVITVTNDRPHNVNVGRNAPTGESGAATRGSTGSD